MAGGGRDGTPRWRSSEGREHARERRRQEHERARVDRERRSTPTDEDAVSVGDLEDDRVHTVPGPAGIGGVLGDLVRARGWEQRLRAAQLEDRWADVVGEQLASRSRPGRLEGGVLQVVVAEPRWATQLQYLQDQIVGRVAAETGIEVRRVRVVVGELDDL